MKIKSNLFINTVIMTAVNLIMRSAGVWFNSFLTNKIGAEGIGLFQLVMTVYSMALTFSCAGIRLAVTRVTVEIRTNSKHDLNKSLSICITYAGICGSVIGFLLFAFSNLISRYWINDIQTMFPLKILAASLPFSAMSSALGGYFTAINKIPQFSIVQMIEQASKIAIVIYSINRIPSENPFYSCSAIVFGMAVAEIISYCLSAVLKRLTIENKSKKEPVKVFRLLRVALPDAAGTCARSILLTVEHLLIPKGFRKSGSDYKTSLTAYGNIHGLAMPLLLYPSAILSSLSALLVPHLAKLNETENQKEINRSVKLNLKRTLIFSFICAFVFFIFANQISIFVYKTNEAAMYIKILSPLVPIMYTDMITDGMLKGLDQQLYSMKYNIIDSSVCVVLVWFLLPRFAVKGYIFILYLSEIINFYLSVSKLITVCDIEIPKMFKYFQEHEEDNSTFFRLKKYLNVHRACGYHTYSVRKKHNQAHLFYRRTNRIQDLHELR